MPKNANTSRTRGLRATSQRTATPERNETESSSPQHLFFNRDESWLRFNGRVLEEAQDTTNPLLERVKFLSITASNLDEFIEVRVAGILQRIEDGYQRPVGEDDDGLTEQERLDTLADRLHRFNREQYACWTRGLIPALREERIEIMDWDELDEASLRFANHYFDREVDPLLTPVTIDPTHPFPRVLNKALCIGLLLRRKQGSSGRRAPGMLGVVTVPRSLPRLIRLPSPEGSYRFLFLHELIQARVPRLFPGYEILARAAFRVTRNSNLYLQEEESRSLLESVRAELHNRRKGDVVRLEIAAGADEELIDQLRVNFELERWQIFRAEEPVNLTRVMEIVNAVERPDLKFPKFVGRDYMPPPQADGRPGCLFDTLRQGDILLHHPFDSFRAVERFIEAGTEDERVISIKQTLYRTSADSPLFQALLDAAQTTDVTVVVELMARFDEDSNIRWARTLEDAGVQVFHGIVGLKTHAKLALLVRKDPDGVTRRYAHLGTGNYNSVTARFYTDISLITADEAVTAAVQRVFNYLTADAQDENFRPLMVAPVTLANDILHLIDREAQHARAGRPARIIAKMNALLDGKTIRALYAASQAGVEIDLIIRGMCSLRPGVRKLSERIRVRSIVGRFLEHSRIFWFANGTEGKTGAADKSEVFCGSADWMPRNLYERCEDLYPVTAPALKKRLREEILEAYLTDTVKSRFLQEDGEYTRPPRGSHPVEAQILLMQLAATESAAASPNPGRTAAAKSATEATDAAADKVRPPAKRVLRHRATKATAPASKSAATKQAAHPAPTKSAVHTKTAATAQPAAQAKKALPAKKASSTVPSIAKKPAPQKSSAAKSAPRKTAKRKPGNIPGAPPSRS
ncbi:polyphosphate kinase 1 [Terriglobus roseus DSM 18391]|uniref:Polyphosphate kinase n=1 Tax=Terriglobus roseus (strain DSM 18391 / NRRL B-41598 / KBS 63) TaxID=926566 RepID=I3ZEM6_TERRK|nr:polyphosphate kinase 1 [Terriglobus roseus]AFL87694.1 polyphosphate kinase 1 [Terriglobus roseus DSM 18391]